MSSDEGTIIHCSSYKLSRELIRIYAARFLESIAAGIILITLPYSVGVLPVGVLFGSLAEPILIGVLISAFGFSLALSQPLAARIADLSTGPNKVATIGLMGAALVTPFMSAVTSYWQLILLRVLQGVFLGFVVPTMVSLVAGYAKKGREGSAIGLSGSVKSLGFCVGPIIGGVMLTVMSFQWAYCFAGMLLLSGSMLLLGVRTRRQDIPADIENARWYCPAGKTNTARLSGRTAKRSFVIPGNFIGGRYKTVLNNGKQKPRACSDFKHAHLGLGFCAFIASCCATSLIVLQNEFLTTLGYSAAFIYKSTHQHLQKTFLRLLLLGV